MQDSSAFQYVAIDLIDVSTTNPRRTFDEGKLQELAESIRLHGLIQPIVVRPKNERFEIVAGERRYRSSLLAERFSVPSHIVELTDAQALEWQLVENSQRVDIHPYEEAQGFQRLLNIPGYDVAALVERSGKSASHIYARLSLLQLIPAVAEAFTEERITASHASLIARLPQESQGEAYEQCWRKDWQDKEPHLLPAKQLAAWIQANLYLALADAPFDREDSTLNLTAGACVTCARRSGYNTSLFCDVQGDQCLDASCYHSKVEAHLARLIAARPDLLQIENGWRSPKEQRAGAIQLGHVRVIETVVENPDAEPDLPCAAAKTALIVFGKRIGTILTVCTDSDCPVHDPQARAEHTANPAPVMAPAGEEETEEEAAEREREYAQRRKEYEEQQQHEREERERQFQKEQEEREAERARREEVQKARQATFDRILENAPVMFSTAQLRTFLKALVNTDPYTFIEDVANYFGNDDENRQQTPEELLTSTVASLPEDKLAGFALRLALTGHTDNPREGEFDFLAEAEAGFVPRQTKKSIRPRKVEDPTLVNSASKKTKKPVAVATTQNARKSV
jgi:ParB family transcriptional regulator, chromosome partitioning protein